MSQQEVVLPPIDQISEKKNYIVVLYSSVWLHQYDFTGTYLETHITNSMPNNYSFLAMKIPSE